MSRQVAASPLLESALVVELLRSVTELLATDFAGDRFRHFSGRWLE